MLSISTWAVSFRLRILSLFQLKSTSTASSFLSRVQLFVLPVYLLQTPFQYTVLVFIHVFESSSLLFVCQTRSFRFTCAVSAI